jgi:ABC-type Na+ efflux pump permease subunit
LVKRGELLMMAAYPLVIGLVSLPALPLSGLSALPYALAAAAARAAAGGQTFPVEVWAWVALNSAVFLAAGLAIFRACLRQARHLGVLGHI